LLDNAVKYSDAGSSVDLRATVTERGDCVNIEVRDHGAGIASRDHERVFERFYRVDRGRSDVPGTGLGLAIVRHVADNLGGEVRLESREGEGSTFTLVLPAGPALSPAGTEQDDSPAEPKAG
jgi:two-component system sensor histidine kinase SenX3